MPSMPKTGDAGSSRNLRGPLPGHLPGPGPGWLVAPTRTRGAARRRREAIALPGGPGDARREPHRTLAAGAPPAAGLSLGLRVPRRVRVALGLAACLAAAGIALGAMRVRSARPDPPALAVMPFLDLGGDPAPEYLGDGIAQEIADRLSSVVPVVDRTGVELRERAGQGAAALGQELGAGYVVQGGVLRGGDRILVRAALVRTADGRRMWAGELDLPLDEVSGVHERVTSGVLHALGVAAGPGEERAPGRRATPSARVYDEYLQGVLAFRAGPGAARLREAGAHLERAVALDPGYGPALAELASIELELHRGFDPRPDRLDRAEELVERALAIDPRLATARLVQGRVRASRSDYTGAAAIFERLAADEPRSDRAWDHLCWALGYVWPRRLAEAEWACRRALELDPGHGETHYHLLRAVAAQGRREEAAEILARIEQRVAGSLVCAGRYVAWMEADRPGQALTGLTACGELSSTGLGLAWQATALAQLRRLDEALARLEEALARGYRDVADLRLSRLNEPLRDDPRLEPLLARYGCPR